jgi:hypothetical protein
MMPAAESVLAQPAGVLLLEGGLVRWPFSTYQAFHFIHKSFVLEITELAGIEEDFFALGTGFHPDMRLYRVYHLFHRDVALGTFDVIDLVVLTTHLGVAYIEKGLHHPFAAHFDQHLRCNKQTETLATAIQ